MPGTPVSEVCGNGDDDCDGEVDEDGVCGDMCEADFDCVVTGPPGWASPNVDGADVALFVQDFGRLSIWNPCTGANPCNGDFNCDHNVDAPDVTKLIEDYGRGWFYYNPCPACISVQDPGPWCAGPMY